MASILAQDIAEAAASLVAGNAGEFAGDRQLVAHDDDPGAVGANNLAPGLDPVVIDEADWAAFGSDTSTAAQGGRVTTNTEELEFSDAATDDGEIAYVTIHREDDPTGAPGTFDVYVQTIELTTPVPYLNGNRVYVPVGDLEIFGAGNS